MTASGGQHAMHVGGLRQLRYRRSIAVVDLGGRLSLRNANTLGIEVGPMTHGQSARGLGNETLLRADGQCAGNLGSDAGLRATGQSAGNGFGGSQGPASKLGRGRHCHVPCINDNWINAQLQVAFQPMSVAAL